MKSVGGRAGVSSELVELWSSGEIQADVADAYRVARREVEACLQPLFASAGEEPLRQRALIGIVLLDRV